MPRVDDQPTEVTPDEGSERAAEPTPEAAAEPAPESAAEPAPKSAAEPAEAPAFETRAQRRARLEATLREPVLPPLATVGRPLTVAATVVFATLLVLGLLADAVLLAAALAWAGLVLAWGWPTLTGSSSRFGASFAIGVAAILVPAAAVASSEEPYLRLVPVALVISLGVMFGHQIVRRDGRPRLTDSLGSTSLAIGIITMGVAWTPLARSNRGIELATVALVSIAAASLGDLVVGVPRLRAWTLPLAMVLGGAGAVITASVVGSPGAGSAALVGFLCAAVSHSLRRVLVVLPAIGSRRAQLAVAAAGLLVPGVIGYVLALVMIG